MDKELFSKPLLEQHRVSFAQEKLKLDYVVLQNIHQLCDRSAPPSNVTYPRVTLNIKCVEGNPMG